MHRRFSWVLVGALALVVGMVNPLLAAAPPAGWTAVDIGGPDPEGSTDVTDGVWTLMGAGPDIWGSYDSMHYAYQRVSGPATITARFLSLADGHVDWAKAGIMVRESDYEGAPNVYLAQMQHNGLRWQVRAEEDASTTGGPAALRTQTGLHEVYVRAQRSGNDIALFHSLDGNVWTEARNAVTIPTLQAEALLGIAITSHQDGDLSTAKFDNVAVQPGASLVYGVTACGGDKAVMVSWKPLEGATSYNLYRAPAGETDLLKFVKVNDKDLTGTTFTDTSEGLVNGQSYTYLITPMVKGADGASTEGARVSFAGGPFVVSTPSGFANISVNEDPDDQLAGCKNLGAAFDPATGIITLRGSGRDIWNADDEFNYTYTEVEGDFQVTVKALTIPTHTNDWAKAGLMVRETTDAGSRDAYFVLTPRNGLTFQWREDTDGGAAWANVRAIENADLKVPLLIRMTRKGDVITGEYSLDDGATWLAGDDPDANTIELVDLPNKVLVGLAITSHQRGLISEAKFQNLEIKKL